MHCCAISACRSIPWLSDPNWALVSVIIADVWQNTPLMVLLFLAGLQSLPQEPLEAAAVDGASAWRTFWAIELPLMRPVIMIALMLRIIDTFRTFDVVWLMTQGGPGGATNLDHGRRLSAGVPRRRFRPRRGGLLYRPDHLAAFARGPLRRAKAVGEMGRLMSEQALPLQVATARTARRRRFCERPGRAMPC